MLRCTRCAGPMFPDEDGDRVCLLCGEHYYDWLSVYTDRLLDAMEQQTLRDRVRERVRAQATAAGTPRRWDAVVPRGALRRRASEAGSRG